MHKITRRRFLIGACASLGLPFLAACSTSSNEATQTESATSEKAQTDANASHDVPFELLSPVWYAEHYYGDEYLFKVSLLIHNKLQDRALYMCPYSVYALDKAGNRIPDKNGEPYEIEMCSYYVGPGQTVISKATSSFDCMTPDDIANVEVVPDMVSETACYFELEPFEGPMFDVTPLGEINDDDGSWKVPLEVKMVEGFKDFARKHGVTKVRVSAGYYDANNNLQSAWENTELFPDMNQPIRCKLPVIDERPNSFARVEYFASPEFDTKTLTKVPFGKTPYE